MVFDKSCSRKLSARNPLIANATSKSREQRSLCSCSAFSSPQLPPRATPNVFKVDVVIQTLINDSRRTKYHCPVAMLCAYFRWFSPLSLRLAKVPKASQCASVTFHVQHHFMAKPRREQFRCQSDAIVPLLETPQFLRVLRLGSGFVDRCSWLFQWARILFVVAIQRETWQQKLDAGI